MITAAQNISPQVKAALNDIISRPSLGYGEVKRISFQHNASYFQVKALLPLYRDLHQAGISPAPPAPAATTAPASPGDHAAKAKRAYNRRK